MISLEDCIALCGLDRDEVDAIMEHEHVPEIEAAAIACELLSKSTGPGEIRQILIDDIRDARARGDLPHAAKLLSALRHFLKEHPEAGHSAEETT